MEMDDTIVAISSSVGESARIIIRASGSAVDELLRGFRVEPPEPASVFRSNISIAIPNSASTSDAAKSSEQDLHFTRHPKPETRNPALTVPCWIYTWKAPASYTGQDLVEFHIPGNPLLARMVMNHCLAHGARAAEAGEFTARAFFAGKIDLAQAEGIAATIEAQNEQELAAARRLMAGELASRLRPAMDKLADLLALVEVGIDFSEEDVKFVSAEEIRRRVKDIADDLQKLKDQSPRVARLSHEPTFVLAGRPNAGKSTLLNALAGQARAIVSPVAGTTRDALSVDIRLRRGLVTVIDVAGVEGTVGLRVSGFGFREIEDQMNERALRAMEEADHLILLRDSTDDRPAIRLPREASLCVFTKADLLAGEPKGFAISAPNGKGISELLDRMDALAFGADSAGNALALTARHLAALDEAAAPLSRAADVAENEEMLALELREALDTLGRILGMVTPDDILGRVFSRFCIGK